MPKPTKLYHVNITKSKNNKISSVRLHFYLFYAALGLMNAAFIFSMHSSYQNHVCAMFNTLQYLAYYLHNHSNYEDKCLEYNYKNSLLRIASLNLALCICSGPIVYVLGFDNLNDHHLFYILFFQFAAGYFAWRSGIRVSIMHLISIEQYEEIEHIKPLMQDLLEITNDEARKELLERIFIEIKHSNQSFLLQKFEHNEKDYILLYEAIRKALSTKETIDLNRVLKCFKRLAPKNKKICTNQQEFKLIYNVLLLHFKVNAHFTEYDLNSKAELKDSAECIKKMNQKIKLLFSNHDKPMTLFQSFCSIFTKQETTILTSALPNSLQNCIIMHSVHNALFPSKHSNYIKYHQNHYLELADKEPLKATSSLYAHREDLDRKRDYCIWEKLVNKTFTDNKVQIILKNAWCTKTPENCIESLYEYREKVYREKAKCNEEFIKYFIKDCLLKNGTGQKLIFRACNNKDSKLMDAIIYFMPNNFINAQNEKRETPIMKISAQPYSEEQINIAKILLENKAHAGLHHLAYSCMYGNRQIVEILHEHCKANNVDISAVPPHPSSIKHTPLMCCLFNKKENERYDIMKLLFKHNVDANVKTVSENETALHIAIARKDTSAIKILIQNKANPNEKNAHDQSSFDILNSLQNITQKLVEKIATLLTQNTKTVKQSY